MIQTIIEVEKDACIHCPFNHIYLCSVSGGVCEFSVPDDCPLLEDEIVVRFKK